MATSSPSDVARQCLELARGKPPTLGTGRLICLDGPAGSGKTTLAAAVADLTPARVIHMDDLYAGWGGLGRVTDQLETLLRPLSRGEPGSYRRFDWHADAFAETVTVLPTDLLVLEGVGAGSLVHGDLCTVLGWVSAPSDLRLERGLARDGEEMREQWLAWRSEEQRLFARERTRARADLLVDGTGRTDPRINPG